MFQRIRAVTAGYPRQFWVLFWGQLINSIGGSMVWPFLTIYMRQRFNAPLTDITLLFTANAAAGFAATTIAGPAVDRFGRKRGMVLSLLGGCVVLYLMSAAPSLPAWAGLMILNGLFGPLYGVGANAMVADLVAEQRRAGAYALLRMVSNLGIAIGPAVGGFITGVSYALAFYIAAAATLAFALLVLLTVRETLPERTPAASSGQVQAPAGYGPVLRDRRFMAFSAAYTLAIIPSPVLMMLLPVFAKEQFRVPESQYGFIMATNAAMVVLFQYLVTQRSQRFPHLNVMALGALCYAVGAGSVALGRGFWAFWLSMVVLTIGELLQVPTATALAAKLAPPDMRGRYMGVLSMTWSAAFGIGPVIGGLLNDRIAPAATWYGMLAIGLVAAAGFLVMRRAQAPRVG